MSSNFDSDESLSRRRFLSFMGRAGASTWAAATALPWVLSACRHATTTPDRSDPIIPGQWSSLAPSRADRLEIIPGLQWKLMIQRGDVITSKGERFGSDNDFLGYVPDPEPLCGALESGLLWVNHEAFTPIFIHGQPQARNKDQVLEEMNSIGGSILKIQKDSTRGWELLFPHEANRRITALTPIPFAWDEPIHGEKQAIGTLSNCCGGKTPWGTVLSCEENYQNFYGEVTFKNGKRVHTAPSYGLKWHEYFDYPPEHYGWVVEIDPKTGKCWKLISMGRFAHEGATVYKSKSGKVVAYMGDDAEDRCIYKFVSARKDSLKTGTLYVANLEQGRWIPLSLKLNPLLRKHFKSQTELLIRAREAALIAGGTRLHRPEDIEVEPKTGAVIVALTNQKRSGDPFGSLLKITEKNGDHAATEFTHETWVSGGTKSGFACPDNLAFDPKGNLWFTSDISTGSIGRGVYTPFGNNSLFYMPLSGPNAGQPIRVANAPVDAEFTGLEFNPSGDTLWVSVQHPGESSPSLGQLTSIWPGDGNSPPKCSIVCITCPLLG